MTPISLALIGFTIISTSFISGLFGMAGGMILVGVLLIYFDVATGMVIFSIIQFVANGWRAVLWWRFVLWRIFFVYVAGAVLAFAVMRYVAIIPSKAAVYLGLGILPFAIELLPARARPNIEWRGVPFVTGVLTTIIQLLTGVGGLFLDIFFQKSQLDRKDHDRHQGGDADLQPRGARGLFRLVRRHRRRGAAVDLRAGDPALDRRHLARRDGAGAHDRRRVPAMDAAGDLRGQHPVSGAGRDAGRGVVETTDSPT